MEKGKTPWFYAFLGAAAGFGMACLLVSGVLRLVDIHVSGTVIGLIVAILYLCERVADLEEKVEASAPSAPAAPAAGSHPAAEDDRPQGYAGAIY